ncbi:MAG: carbohydrate ABC transporter permease [Gaiellaceae bacterium]
MAIAAASERLRERRVSRVRISTVLGYVVLLGVTALSLYPLYWMVTSAFKPGVTIITQPLTFDPHAATLSNFKGVLANTPIGTGFKNTAIVLALKGSITMFFCPLAGYAFAKFEFRGKQFLFGFVLLTLMLPTLVLMIPLLLEMSALSWVNSYQALILPGAIDAFSIFWMRQVIAEYPDELLDAGRIDGCGPFSLYWRLIVPAIKPGLAALAVLTFLNIYNDFVWPVVVTNTENMQTLQVVLSNLASTINANQLGADWHNVWGELLAGSTIATIPVLVLFLILQRQFMRGILAGSVKG